MMAKFLGVICSIVLLSTCLQAQIVQVGMPVYGELETFTVSADGKTVTNGEQTFDCHKKGDDLVIDCTGWYGILTLKRYYTEDKKGQVDDNIGPNMGTWEKIELMPVR